MSNDPYWQRILEQLAQQYSSLISHYFCCRLDNEPEAERLTRETLCIAAATASRSVSLKDNEQMLSLAADLLRRRWLKSRSLEMIERSECTAEGWADDLEDKAVALYLKLRTLQENLPATTEASAAIHHWIGNDPLRQAVYDRVRKGLYHMGSTDTYIAPDFAPNNRPAGQHTRFDWTDVALLLLVFLLLLPLIYFLAVPAG